MTPRARKEIEEAEVVVGYKTYLKLIEPLLDRQDIFSSGMGGEIERGERALKQAALGRRVAVVSSGDAGIYGMAGLILELIHERDYQLSVEVIPGVTAASAAASLLGAPLMHDHVVISLSDLLTPWEKIVHRLKLAAKGDFVLALYNPRSHGRKEHINRAQKILLKHRAKETPVGIVRSAGREGEEVILTSLGEMLEHRIDMLTTVIVGSSRSFSFREYLVTPRGYFSVKGGDN